MRGTLLFSDELESFDCARPVAGAKIRISARDAPAIIPIILRVASQRILAHFEPIKRDLPFLRMGKKDFDGFNEGFRTFVSWLGLWISWFGGSLY